MAKKLVTETKTTAVAMLCEGNSIRSVERITGIHRDTAWRPNGRGLPPDYGRENAESALPINSGR
jgi:transposase-like protein